MLVAEGGRTVGLGCRILKISRAWYFTWLAGERSKRPVENTEASEKVVRTHEEHPDMGHRRLLDQLEHDYDIMISDKRALRICRKLQVFSTIKYRNQ